MRSPFSAMLKDDSALHSSPHPASTMTTRTLVYIALFAALVAALGLIPPIPLPFLPVPITAQTLGVMLAGSLLGARRGGAALLLFLLLVAAGLPILSGGRGGLGVFLSPSGGFLLGFPLGAFVIGWLTERQAPKRRFLKRSQRLALPLAITWNLLGGIVVIYAIGIPWVAIAAQMSFTKALIGSAIFIPGDVAKAVLAAIVAVSLERVYPLRNSFQAEQKRA